MLYTTLKTNENEYKLRLNAKSTVAVEKKLGVSMLTFIQGFYDGEDNIKLPMTEDIITIIHGALAPYHPEIKSLDQAYDVYDEYLESGETFTDFIPVLLDLLKVSGFFKEAPQGAAIPETVTRKKKN